MIFCRPLQILLIVLAVFLWGSPALAGESDDALGEYQVQAAFIYNFAKFVKWPSCDAEPCPDGQLVIRIYGPEPLGEIVAEAMEIINGKKAGGRTITSRLISDPKDISGCQILFLFSLKTAEVESVLDFVDGQPILTVSDIAGFARSGGMIELIKRDNKMRFTINRKAASETSIYISARLLKLAQQVVD